LATDEAQLPLLQRATIRRALGFFLAVLIAGQLTLLAFDLPLAFDISFPEGAVVNRAYQVAQGNSAYEDWRVWPHGFAPYGPLTYYPAGWAARAIFGAEVHPLDLYRVGRAQSALCFLGTLILFGAILRRVGARWLWALPAVAGFLSWRIQVETTLSFRPDAPQLFFSMLAIWIAVCGPATRYRILAALAALMASMWFKPMSWGVLLAIAYWISRTRGWRRAGLIVALFGGTGLAVALVVNRLVGGTLLLNMLAEPDIGFSLRQIVKLREHIGWADFGFFAAGYITGWVGLFSARGTRRETWNPSGPFFFALVISLPIALVQALKVGSSANYLLESYALSSVALGWGISRIWPTVDDIGSIKLGFRKRISPLLLGAALIFFGAAAAFQLVDLRDELEARQRLWEPPPVARLLEGTPGLILSTTPYYSLMHPSEPTVLDYAQYINLHRRMERGDSDLIERVEAREFALILLPAGTQWIYSAQFVPAVDANYVASERYGPLVVWRPRQN